MDDQAMLAIALEEARKSLAEGGIPIGAALFDANGNCVGRGHNQRVQRNDPTAHGEIDAVRAAGPRDHYSGMTLVTTLAPCWYCSGFVRMFGVSRVVFGEDRNHRADGSVEWLRDAGTEMVDLDSEQCVALLADWKAANAALWDGDSGNQPTVGEV